MTMVRKYYADWYEMYSRSYPYAALSAGAVYPSAAAGKSHYILMTKKECYRIITEFDCNVQVYNLSQLKTPW